jgi:hypothetical protein
MEDKLPPQAQDIYVVSSSHKISYKGGLEEETYNRSRVVFTV